jgi:hypothetical protein
MKTEPKFVTHSFNFTFDYPGMMTKYKYKSIQYKHQLEIYIFKDDTSCRL